LASYRQGLIGRLLRTYGDPHALTTTDPVRLRKAAAGAPGRSGRLGASASSGGERVAREGGRSTDAHAPSCDAAAFGRVLQLPPLECLRQPRPAGGRLVTWVDAEYPPALRQLSDPPLCLFVRAHCTEEELGARLRHLATRPSVAVVGSRAPSGYGEEMATLLGRDLAARGLLVVSGLAMGIDALAQKAALSVPSSADALATAAVLGCGADVVYPAANRRLFADVGARGLLISEFAWGVPARAWRFPARNRVMAGLAQAVVVVEGSERSGARLTADFGLDLGREILAVPGEAGRRLSAAPHGLLRQGAALCESADDVLAALGPLVASLTRPHAVSPGLPGDDTAGGPRGRSVARVLAALERGPLAADQIAAQSALSAAEVSTALSELEIEGLVRRHDGGRFRLAHCAPRLQ
jgi:DNA processing protein